MARPTSERRGIQLPKALRDELNLGGDDQKRPSRPRNASGHSRLDRKEQRKKDRQEKKDRCQHHAQHNPPVWTRVDDEVQPALEKVALERTKTAKLPKSSSRSDPKTPKLPKTSFKTRKRKAMSLEDDNTASRKRLSKRVKDKLAEDEAEIRALEKKLKIKNKKIPKGFEEDGLDFLLEDLKDDYLGDQSEDGNESEDVDMGDGLDDILGDGSDSDEDGPNFEGDRDESSSTGDSAQSDDEEEWGGIISDTEETSSIENPAPPPPPKPSIYQPFQASTEKYVPPSLRKLASTESEQLVRLRRQLQGLLNRFSESNLLPILTEVETIYRNNPRGDVTNILTDTLLATICDRSSLLDTFTILHGGFIAGVYKLMGTDFGAHVVQRLVEKFDENHVITNGVSDPSAMGKECTNLVSLLSELYNFDVVSAVLVFDFIRFFLSELTELHTEFLLKIVRNSGPQLRSDDPTALKSLIQLLQPAIAKVGGQANLSTRTKFMIETLTNLKNNRLKPNVATTQVTREATTRMKKLLGSLNTRRLRATEPLRPTLDDIRNTDKKGKWWLVGASWAGSAPPSTATTTSSTPQTTTDNFDDEFDEDEDYPTPDLPALARHHGMNTPARRLIFSTLLSASDYQDALSRLRDLRLPRAQQPELSRVIVHCALAEPVHNPYYTLLSRNLISTSHQQQKSYIYLLWSYLEKLDDMELREIVNLGRLYGGLSAVKVGEALKTTESWVHLGDMKKTFLEVYLGAGFSIKRSWEDGQWEDGLRGQVDVLRGLEGYLRRHGAGVAVAAGEKGEKVVKDAKRRIQKLVEEMV